MKKIEDSPLFGDAHTSVVQGVFWIISQRGKSWGKALWEINITKGSIFDTSRAIWALCSAFPLLPLQLNGGGKYKDYALEDIKKLMVEEVLWLISLGNSDPHFSSSRGTKYWVSSDINNIEVVRTTNAVLLTLLELRELIRFEAEKNESFGGISVTDLDAEVTSTINQAVSWIKFCQVRTSDVITIREGDLDYSAIYTKGSWPNIPRHIFYGLKNNLHRGAYAEAVERNTGYKAEVLVNHLDEICHLSHLQATSDSIISLGLHGTGENEVSDALEYLALEQKSSGVWDSIVCSNLFIVLGMLIGIQRLDINLQDIGLDGEHLLFEPVKEIESGEKTQWIRFNEKESIDICILTSLIFCKKYLGEKPEKVLEIYLSKIKQVGGRDATGIVRWWPASKLEDDAVVSKTAWAISSISSLLQEEVLREYENQVDDARSRDGGKNISTEMSMPGINIGLSGPTLNIVEWAKYLHSKLTNASSGRAKSARR